MFIYNVTVNVEESVHEEWLRWMKEIHIPEVMGTGCFVENRVCKLVAVADEGKTYSVQYTYKTEQDLEHYQKNFAPALQASHNQKFRDKFVAFRTLLEIVH